MEGRDITGQGVIRAKEENRDAGILKCLEDRVLDIMARGANTSLRRIF